jgi:hypothetical protein
MMDKKMKVPNKKSATVRASFNQQIKRIFIPAEDRKKTSISQPRFNHFYSLLLASVLLLLLHVLLLLLRIQLFPDH